MATSAAPIRAPLAAGAGFVVATIVSAILSLTLFILHVKEREPAVLDYVAAPILTALVGILGGAFLFRSFRTGGAFGATFALFPPVARTLYQIGRTIPYGSAALDLLISFYFAILIPALASGLIGAIAVTLTHPYHHATRRGFTIFMIAGAVGGIAAPIISWLLAQMAAESAIAATLSIYGEELVRFSLAGAGLAWVLRRESGSVA